MTDDLEPRPCAVCGQPISAPHPRSECAWVLRERVRELEACATVLCAAADRLATGQGERRAVLRGSIAAMRDVLGGARLADAATRHVEETEGYDEPPAKRGPCVKRVPDARARELLAARRRGR